MILVIWGAKGGNFKIFGDELILDILELQMKSKEKKGLLRRIYISSFETYTRYSQVADKKKVLGGDCFFKYS